MKKVRKTDQLREWMKENPRFSLDEIYAAFKDEGFSRKELAGILQQMVVTPQVQVSSYFPWISSSLSRRAVAHFLRPRRIRATFSTRLTRENLQGP